MSLDFHILLVEDSPTDAMIIARALREGGVAHRLTVIRDGRQALDYLIRLRNPAEPADLEPDLILLDLNLPGIDGGQVLVQIKADPFLRAIPVVILSTSKAEEDVYRTYDLGANSFITKPVTFEGLVDVMKSLGRYWFHIVELPPDGQGG